MLNVFVVFFSMLPIKNTKKKNVMPDAFVADVGGKMRGASRTVYGNALIGFRIVFR